MLTLTLILWKNKIWTNSTLQLREQNLYSSFTGFFKQTTQQLFNLDSLIPLVIYTTYTSAFAVAMLHIGDIHKLPDFRYIHRNVCREFPYLNGMVVRMGDRSTNSAKVDRLGDNLCRTHCIFFDEWCTKKRKEWLVESRSIRASNRYPLIQISTISTKNNNLKQIQLYLKLTSSVDLVFIMEFSTTFHPQTKTYTGVSDKILYKRCYRIIMRAWLSCSCHIIVTCICNLNTCIRSRFKKIIVNPQIINKSKSLPPRTRVHLSFVIYLIIYYIWSNHTLKYFDLS